MKRSLHPRPYSGFDNRIERTAEGLNSLCLYLIPAAFFAWVLLADNDVKPHHEPVKQEVSQAQEGDGCFEYYGVTCEKYMVIIGQSIKETRKEQAKTKKTTSLSSLMDKL